MLPVTMRLLAQTTLEKLKQVPAHTWWMIALGVGAFFVLLLLVRLAGQVNKFLLGGIVVIIVFVVGMEWVYDRNEPAWATPFVDTLAGSGFLPTAGKHPPKPGEKTPPPGH